MRGLQLFILGMVSGIYIVVGALIFMYLENEGVVKTDVNLTSEWLYNTSCLTADEFTELSRAIITAYQRGVLPSNDSSDITTWDIHTSIYFAVTVVTTIGYGNITPGTFYGQLFCVFFALIGIPLVMSLLAQIGIKLSKQRTRFADWLDSLTCEGISSRHPKTVKIIRVLLIDSSLMGLFMFIPAFIFQQIQGWTYGEALYYTFITLTTIGFGDYVAGFGQKRWDHPTYLLMIAGWIFLGLAWMSSVIAAVQEILDTSITKAQETAKKKYDELNLPDLKINPLQQKMSKVSEDGGVKEEGTVYDQNISELDGPVKENDNGQRISKDIDVKADGNISIQNNVIMENL